MITETQYRFAFVSTSATIASMVKALCDARITNLQIHLATMEEALPVAQELLRQGAEVIIGAGATGKLLRKQLDRPVVTIARTALDVLRALMKANEIDRDILLTSFDSLTDGTDLFEKLLDVRIRQLVFRTSIELAEGIEREVRQGTKCVVGSGICRDICRSLGVEGIIIYPGKSTVIQALEEATAIALSQRKQREDAEHLRSILQTITDGVIGIDAQGTVNLINHAASELLGLESDSILGVPLPKMLDGIGMQQVLRTGKADIDQIRRIADIDVVVNTLPLKHANEIRGVVASFKPASRISHIDHKLKSKLYDKGFKAKFTLNHIKGESEVMSILRHRAAQYANTDASVLILGETGTGKELIAQAIHNAGDRKNKPFVAVNCAALPESLLESELFGYEEGAFTGAKRGGKAGLFELANQGSIFLDEIADISPHLQVRLLRVLEQRELMRLGGDRIVPVDVKVISSTWRNLAKDVVAGRFRPDLYFRLTVLKLNVPPLRERPEDIPLLLSEILWRMGIRNTLVHNLLDQNVIHQLRRYSWPGNVRELDALCRRFTALRENDPKNGKELFLELLDEMRLSGLDHASIYPACTNSESSNSASLGTGRLKNRVEEFEREVIRKTLAECGNDRQVAAFHLGVSVNTLWRKLRQ